VAEGLLLVGASGLAREVLAAGITGVAGILDDNVELHETEIGGIPVVGSVVDAVKRDESLLVCVGPSQSRRNVVRRFRKFGVDEQRYATFVARSARIGRSSDIGPGSILLDNVVVTADAVLGRHVVVMPNCTITHDAVLEDFATLAAGVALGGTVRVGEATVGMGAVVLTDVPAEATWAGVPAREIGARA
jgi:UDP-3-O-[3-hydroxymyristoyl] glucosamine N-acyltransferase